MLTATRNTWDVEDNWIAFHGLGDPVDDVIKDMSSVDMKVRLASTLAVANRASSDSTDKRGVAPMIARLVDKEPAIVSIAAAAFTIPGWIDATVDPCLRNQLIGTLQAVADPTVTTNDVTRAEAAKALQFLNELGTVDRNFLPIADKCGPGSLPFVPPHVNVGPPAGQGATPAVPLTVGEKVAVVGAAGLVLGVLAYAVLGRPAHVPVRRRLR